MMLVHPDYRRRGIGRALIQRALDHLQALGVQTIKLDATDMGRPLYQSLGFEDECPIERWLGLASEDFRPTECSSINPLADVEQISELDWEAFGADRRAVLKLLLDHSPACCFYSASGYIMARPGSKARFLGPCVARNSTTASQLVEKILARHAGQPVFWDLFPSNDSAREIATQFGLTCKRQLVRMWHPACGGRQAMKPTDVRMQYAAAGFEYG